MRGDYVFACMLLCWCDSDAIANVDVEIVSRTEHGVFHRAGIGPSTGVLEFPPLIETGEARVDDLSLGIYAPGSHALVIKVRVNPYP